MSLVIIHCREGDSALNHACNLLLGLCFPALVINLNSAAIVCSLDLIVLLHSATQVVQVVSVISRVSCEPGHVGRRILWHLCSRWILGNVGASEFVDARLLVRHVDLFHTGDALDDC